MLICTIWLVCENLFTEDEISRIDISNLAYFLRQVGQELNLLSVGNDGNPHVDTISEDDDEGVSSALEDALEDLQTEIDCLVYLTPALENPAMDFRNDEAPREVNVQMSSTNPNAFISFINGTFPNASNAVVERLGKKTLDTFLRLHESRRISEDNRNDAEVVHLVDETGLGLQIS